MAFSHQVNTFADLKWNTRQKQIRLVDVFYQQRHRTQAEVKGSNGSRLIKLCVKLEMFVVVLRLTLKLLRKT